MRFTTVFFATTTFSTLAVCASSSKNDEDNRIADLLSSLRSYDDDVYSYKRDETYDMGPLRVHYAQSNALNNLSLNLQELSKDGKLDMQRFDDNKAIWAAKLSEIEAAAEGKLPGPYNMDILIMFHRRHWKKFQETSTLRENLGRSNSFGSTFVDEVMRLYTEMYKLYSFDGTVNTKAVNIETKLISIDNDLSTLAKQVKDAKNLPVAVTEFYAQTSADVRASLNEVREKLARTNLDKVLEARDFDFWE